MEEEKEKMGFFTKLKTSIFKLEEYDRFLTQKFSSNVGYFILLILILTAIFTAVYTYQYSKQLDKAFSYIKNEMPDFVFENNTLKSENNVEAYDEEYNVRLFINTDNDVSEDTLNEYMSKISSDTFGLIALKDKITLVSGNVKTDYEYANFEQYIGAMEITNKQTLIDIIDATGKGSIISLIFFNLLVAYFISYLIELTTFVLLVAIFGHIASGFARVKFPIKKLITLAIYSVTLPNILYILYIILNLLTGFYIKYFSIFYMLISCVYIFTAIFMIKSDIIRQQQEIQAIAEVQKQVKEEADKELEKPNEEEKREKDEEKNEEPKEDEAPIIDENNEPDGSEI